MEIEAQPLLIGDDEKLGRFMYAQRLKKESRPRSWVVTVTTHSLVALAVLFAVIFSSEAGFYHHKLWNVECRPKLYSPLEPAIKYVIDRPPSDSWSNPLYFGPPSNESEMAWNKLIHPHGLQVFPEEMEHLDTADTVKLKNGNHLFIMDLYHHLHCLRRMRQTMHADHYYPNMTEQERQHDLEHTAHCLEGIRSSLMCQPDLSLDRFFWSGRSWHDLSVLPPVSRMCVNWSLIETFMQSRTYEEEDIVKAKGENSGDRYGN